MLYCLSHQGSQEEKDKRSGTVPMKSTTWLGGRRTGMEQSAGTSCDDGQREAKAAVASTSTQKDLP